MEMVWRTCGVPIVGPPSLLLDSGGWGVDLASSLPVIIRHPDPSSSSPSHRIIIAIDCHPSSSIVIASHWTAPQFHRPVIIVIIDR